MALTRRGLLSVAGGGVALWGLPGRAAETRTLAGPAFGSAWRVVVPDRADLAETRSAIEAVVHAVDASMSPYDVSSDLSRFNRAAHTGWIAVPASVGAVVATALEVGQVSGGAFDPTVGPLVHRFGFGPIEGDAKGGAASIFVRPGALRKARAGLTLDLCGIAKGHAVDQMAVELRSMGLTDFLIEVGGEILAQGHAPSGRSWQVGIEVPGARPVSLQHILRLDGQALATSGQAPQSYGVLDATTGHIIDPKTARPVASGLAAVSVIADTCALADALATALMAIGPEAGVAMAEKLQISALFLTRAEMGLRETMTAAFSRYILA